jgi:hypothetical protein
MKTIEFIEQADADKVVRVTIPVDEAARRYRLIVQIELDHIGESGEGLDDWPPGFFERTAGTWIGDLALEPQGDFEQRATL